MKIVTSNNSKNWWDNSTQSIFNWLHYDNLTFKVVSNHCINHTFNLVLVPYADISNSGITGYFILPSACIKNLSGIKPHHNNMIRWLKSKIFSHMQSGSPMVTTPINHPRTSHFFMNMYKAILCWLMQSGFWQGRVQSILWYTFNFNRPTWIVIKNEDIPCGSN